MTEEYCCGFLVVLYSHAVDGHAIVRPIWDGSEEELFGTGDLYFLSGGLPAELVVDAWEVPYPGNM